MADPNTAGGGTGGLREVADLRIQSRLMAETLSECIAARARETERADAAEAALARASAEQARVEAAVRAALDDACRMETIRLKVVELSPLEQQLASIVAGTVKGAVLAALKREQGVDDAP